MQKEANNRKSASQDKETRLFNEDYSTTEGTMSTTKNRATSCTTKNSDYEGNIGTEEPDLLTRKILQDAIQS
jgi:hypothetical protein